MIEFEFDIRRTRTAQTEQDIELLYVLEGAIELVVDDRRCILEHDNFVIINAGQVSSFTSDKELLLGRFSISTEKLCGLMKCDVVEFKCNSTVDGKKEAYEETRAIIKDIFVSYNASQTQDTVGLQLVYYKLLHILTTNFLVTAETQADTDRQRQDKRAREIEEYIKQNYDKQIRLNDLADRLHLSTAYLSKYIKKQFGMSFLEYVNKVRLSHAITELMSSDKSVAHISMDIGFANLTAFNKVFKDTYKVTPSVFRRQYKAKHGEATMLRTVQKLVEPGQEDYELHNIRRPEDVLALPQVRTMHQTVKLTDENRMMTPLSRNWNKLINIGTARDLLRSDVQQHLLELKKLGFKYVRFWDIYTPELFLNRHTAERSYNFFMLDKVLDFLVNNDMIPYIEISHRPKVVFKNTEDVKKYKTPEDIFYVPDSLEFFMTAFMKHILSRYGIEQVGIWYFEYCKSEQLQDLPDEIRNIEIEQYLNRFERIARVFRKLLPHVQIGGGSFWIRPQKDMFPDIIRQWAKRKEQPTFISLSCFPYDLEEEAALTSGKSTMQDGFFKMLTNARRIIDAEGVRALEFHVSMWNMTIFNRKLLNDSCYKGAYVMKNILENIDRTDMLGYWMGTDLFAEYSDMRDVVDGVSGLITRDGIRKPAWYAIEFLDQLGTFLEKRGENYIITSDGYGNWRIACHNFKGLNYQYYLARQDMPDNIDSDKTLSDITKLVLGFELPCEKGKNYTFRVMSVNRHRGSIQDEWMRMNKPSVLESCDVEYLRSVSTPQLKIDSLRESGGELKFETELEPNEIQIIMLNEIIE